MEIAKRMFEVMAVKHVKAVQLASFIGVNPTVVSTWRTRQTDPPAQYLERICVFLSVSLDFLVTGRETTQSGPELTTDEQTLLNMYRHLDLLEKGKILGKMEAILEKDSYYSAPEACEVKSQTKRVG